jgi:hypothetical protein
MTSAFIPEHVPYALVSSLSRTTDTEPTSAGALLDECMRGYCLAILLYPAIARFKSSYSSQGIRQLLSNAARGFRQIPQGSHSTGYAMRMM